MSSIYKKHIIPVQGWVREQQYHFFKDFTQPFFNVHTQVDLTPLYQHCKAHGHSVFLGYLYATLHSARATENFLYRLEQGQVVQYEAVDLSTTVLKNDHSIAFAHLPYQETLADFCAQSQQILAQVRESKALFHGHQGNDLLHLTTLPWFTYKGVEHAFTINPENPGIPKLAFGKLEKHQGTVTLPMSIGLHHALADGYHVHLFLEKLQQTIQQYS